MNTTKTALAQLEAAAAAGKLSASAAANIRTWLTQPYLRDYAPQVAEHLAAEKWAELEEAFWTTIPFGTGGRRGRMYPIGCNAINDRTIGETAQGLADYVKDARRPPMRGSAIRSRPLACAIAYDTRHRSRQFAELCSEIMAAAGFTVYFLDGYRSTPELSFTVRYKQCDCGIMITASHNPPSDNAVKVYGPSGGQYVPPHDAASIDRDAAGHLDQADAVCRGAGRRQGRLLPGGGRRRVHQGRAGPERARPAQSQNPLFAAARRGGVGRVSGAAARPASATWRSSARTPSPTATSPTCPTTSPTRKTPPSSTP